MQGQQSPGPQQQIGRGIEVYNPDFIPGRIRYAVLDFDGTLSLLRAGWQEVMMAQCVGELEQTPTGETREQLQQICHSFITRLTGRQTIYQMLRLEAEIRKRGGTPRPALAYKQEYLDLLHHKIRSRIDRLRNGQDPPERYLVRGSTALLEGLVRRGVTCYLASGTDREFVVDETDLLGLMPYFKEVYGALDNYKAFSKKILIERIVSENRLQGAELAAFGDGYVEIENVREAGGLAVGVASRESGEHGWDQWKKTRLLEVGADVLVPDWQEADLLLAYLFGEGD